MDIEYQLSTDVLVVGSGGAGIKAAIKAAEAGADALLVSKKPFGRTGSTFYPGTPGWGMNAILHEGDSPEYYFEEILEAGAGTVNRELAWILATQCTERFHELEDYGLEFNRGKQGQYLSVIPCFGKRLRGSTTFGIDKIRHIMWKTLMKRGVRLRNGVDVISLVTYDKTCYGAIALDELGESFFIKAGAVVLAAGGASSLFKYSLATNDQTGDGYAIALEAGARLVNMEFIQFIPGLTSPVKKLLFQEKNLDTYPRITNREGKDVLELYLPENKKREECLTERAKHGPFSTLGEGRWLDIAMYEEQQKGNALESGGIHLQYDQSIYKDHRWYIRSWLEWMESRGIDVVKEGFDMIPHAQGFNGGVLIDKNAATDIKGLFAAGETAGGMHGADRLGGAAIASTQVFGAIAGTKAAEHAGKVRSSGTLKDAEYRMNILLQAIGKSSDELKDSKELTKGLQELMWNNAAIVRSEKGCAEGLQSVEAMFASIDRKNSLNNIADRKKVFSLFNSLTVARAMLTSMRYRKESRGPHFRSDYPETNNRYEGIISLYNDGSSIQPELFRTN